MAKDIEKLGKEVLGAALSVHRVLGPGLLESTYEACLVHELAEAGIECKSQVALPVSYKGRQIEAGYRLDLLVEDRIIVEIKSVENLLPIHQAQILSYLKLSGMSLGFLINFNTQLLKNGTKRIVHGDQDFKKSSWSSRSSW